jgi:activator of 2-hydroxyglutaryl-CoA dehydratase/predicted nucleotide-binding protein (sugar kinase/HSP70/actin superfamily)
LRELLADWDWDELDGAAVSGRLARQVRLPQVPTKQAQVRGYRYLFGRKPATVVSIGSHGFSVLELRANGLEVFRENSRCSQGTGNFLRQLVERFSLTVEEASRLAAPVEKPAVLSGRCPVILKTDMTHLANKGEDRARILAGLFDAVCENVLVLVKPELCPERVVLIGGVARSPRVQTTFRRRLEELGLKLILPEGDAGFFLEALGSAAVAAEEAEGVPPLAELIAPRQESQLERVPALAGWLDKVRRLPPRPLAIVNGTVPEIILGLDIGSTGSKAVALTAQSRETVWEGYRPTAGDPVGAAQALLREFAGGVAGRCPVLGFGVTGSGREIVGSLLSACYGKAAVFILNEIAAHAEGARFYDERVDTIFEIGGQDAKYIRLAGGRVVDCAMNEACSAGTGSFIAEQGGKFAGIRDVVHLGAEALAAREGVSLGQHCSVFMAEVIDEAVAADVPQPAIVAGLYDSIVQNYLNRVKGSRTVGQVIFCQGMPFAADALAAAVARQTGSEVIVPPNPGTVGALGIALLAQRELCGGRQLSHANGLVNEAVRSEGGDHFRWSGLTPRRSQRVGVNALHQRNPNARTPVEADLCPEDAGKRIDPERFLQARVEAKDTFHCKASVGCGGTGNCCRIERLRTVVAGQRQAFTWGGGCALHDKGTRKRKLPDLAPDPFREREELRQTTVEPYIAARGRKRVALTDEFALKGLFPFFAAYLHELGFDLTLVGGGDQADLKRGIQGASVPFCAPMQLYHGVAARLADAGADFVFLPMLRGGPAVADETHAVTCPIVQASADVVRWDLAAKHRMTVVSPVIDLGRGGYESTEFSASCQRLAAELGVTGDDWRRAQGVAQAVQAEFERRCVELGARAIEFCAQQGIVPVVVLGRPYTIYNPVLNSNVPAILREQGAIGIPLDCYPVESGVPVFGDMYWGYGQRILRAAHQIRRTPGQYAVYCSNYACGPDSFNLHFFAHIMAGRPFAIVETDGHSGDAGTKTRIEAFLHCVEQDRQASGGLSGSVDDDAGCRSSANAILRVVSDAATGKTTETADKSETIIRAGSGAVTGRTAGAAAVPHDFSRLQTETVALREILSQGERLLIPWMGAGSEVLAAGFRGMGIPAESLPPPDRDALRHGRRHTSGKECLPMALTLGGLLQRLERAAPDDRFAYLMASTNGPCRFGVYNLLNQVVLQRLGWQDRVRIWSPCDTGYFAEFPPGFAMLVFAGFMAADLLQEAWLDVQSSETRPGAAGEIHRRALTDLLALMESAAAKTRSTPASLWQAASGRLFGIRDLLTRAAAEFAAVRGPDALPTVLVVGEIYVRCVPFANGFAVEELQRRGLRVQLAPMHEWLDYCDHQRRRNAPAWQFGPWLSDAIQGRIQRAAYAAMDGPMGWPARPTTGELLDAARPYLRDDLEGEAVLTLGNPLVAWRQGRIDGVLSVGPHECMPNKIAEAQFSHIAEREGLPALTLPVNGDPVNPEVLDNFAFEVHARSRDRRRGDAGQPAARPAAATPVMAGMQPPEETEREPGDSVAAVR